MRCSAASADELAISTRVSPLYAQFALCGIQGLSGPPGPRLASNVRSARHHHQLARTTTGRHQFPEKLIPHVIISALEGQQLPVYGDGRQIRDWLHVDDHADALLDGYAAAEKAGEIYTIGGRCEQRNIDVVRTICTVLDDLRPRPNGGSYHRPDRVSSADRPGHDRRYAIDQLKDREPTRLEPAPNLGHGTGRNGWVVSRQLSLVEGYCYELPRQRLGLEPMTRKGIVLAGGSGSILHP